MLLAPGDTFRAAAAEQLAAWAKRCGAKMGTFKEGGRPGGVLAAACNDAKQRKDVDVVICDTGGVGVLAWMGLVQLGVAGSCVDSGVWRHLCGVPQGVE